MAQLATIAATGADTAMAIDAGDERADGGQIDVVVGVDVGLVGRAERVGAMRAGGQYGFDDAIGVLGQRAGDAGTTGAGLLLAIGKVGLLALRGRRARIVRRLRRRIEPGLQRRDARRQGADLRRLGEDQGDEIILGEGEEGFAIHRYRESNRP